MAFAPDYRSDGCALLTVFSQGKGQADTLPRSAPALSSKDLHVRSSLRGVMNVLQRTKCTESFSARRSSLAMHIERRVLVWNVYGLPCAVADSRPKDVLSHVAIQCKGTDA